MEENSFMENRIKLEVTICDHQIYELRDQYNVQFPMKPLEIEKWRRSKDVRHRPDRTGRKPCARAGLNNAISLMLCKNNMNYQLSISLKGYSLP